MDSFRDQVKPNHEIHSVDGNKYPFVKSQSNRNDGKKLAKRDSFIPSVPEIFCFVDENFLSDSFSVDGFVRRNSKRVNSLETLKEHLNAYLKILRQSMIDLVNENYTEFINLSANLISFEKSINNIKLPVMKLKSETGAVKNKIEGTIFSLKSKQERLKMIGDNKQKLKMMLEIIDYLDRIEANVKIIEDGSDESVFYAALNENSTLISRLNVNFDCLLETTENKKATSNFLLKLRQRFDLVSEKNYKIMESQIFSLIDCDQKEDAETLVSKIEQLFVMYMIDGKKDVLQSIIRNGITRPWFDEINQKTTRIPEELFSEMLRFIDQRCSLLINVLTTSQLFIHSFKFELIIRTIWDPIVEFFLVQTPLLFDLSDSDGFERNYFLMFEFIEQFLSRTSLTGYRSEFFQEMSYMQLKSKFNLNVYFHMKLQKIAMKMEKSFENYRFSLEESKDAKFKLKITGMVHENLLECWQNTFQKSYIGDLFIYLWRLTLKILSRFSMWVNQIDLENLDSFVNSLNNPNDSKRLTHQILAALVTDSHWFIQTFRQLFHDVIEPLWEAYYPRLSTENTAIQKSSMAVSFEEAVKDFQFRAADKTLVLMRTKIVDECKRLLNQVNDIPRLYRRTNKEKPTGASAYVGKCIEELMECITLLDAEVRPAKWLPEILADLAQHYKNLTLEVLTSVQKTEDSLKKLKKLKVNAQQNPSPTGSSMSDDDKIRLQIYHDVKRFGNELQDKFAIDPRSIKPYRELLETIESLKVSQ